MIIKQFIIIIICFYTSISFTQTIDKIEFKGLTKTDEGYLNSLIKCKLGSDFNAEILKEDEQVLNNLNLFFSVQSQYQINDSINTVSIFFDIVESTYFYPLVSISGFKNTLKIQAGLNQINWQGKQKTIGFWYQYYDRHSFSIFQKTPHHQNKKTGHEVAISKYSTVEPLYFKELTSIFNFDNYSIALNGLYWFNNKNLLKIGFTPIYEIYQQVDSIDLELEARRFEFFKFRFNGSYVRNHLNYKFERISGLFNELYAETILTHKAPMSSFVMAYSNTVYHKHIKKKGNLSIRHQFGLSTNNESPFAPFVLDGFINLRGIGNRVSRGTGIHFVNLEYRHTILKRKFFDTQFLIFSDFGNIRQPASKTSDLFDYTLTKVFAGAGLRIHLKKYYKNIFRLDYGIQLNSKEGFNGGFSFGLGHFF